jgi:hypothetical protein
MTLVTWKPNLIKLTKLVVYAINRVFLYTLALILYYNYVI